MRLEFRWWYKAAGRMKALIVTRVKDKERDGLALSEPRILREWLSIVIFPRRQVRVGVRFDVRVDIRLRREIRRVASNVDVVRILVYSNVVDSHCCGECQMLEVHIAKIAGHAQVGNDVHRFLRNWARPNLNGCVSGHTALV